MDAKFMAFANALATRFDSAGVGTAWSTLMRLARGCIDVGSTAQRALESAQASPDDERIRGLADELWRIAESDGQFADSVRELWPAASRELAAVVTQNQISGAVLGNALQAGTLHVNGDLKFGNP